MKKKLLTLVLTLALLIGVIAAVGMTASAATNPTIGIIGESTTITYNPEYFFHFNHKSWKYGWSRFTPEEVKERYGWEIDDSGYAKYEDGVLHLYDFQYKNVDIAEEISCITSDGDLTIQLHGSSTINLQSAYSNGKTIGINVKGKLTVTGDGSLTIKADKKGIICSSLEFVSGQLIVYSGDEYSGVTATGDINLKGGDLNVYAGYDGIYTSTGKVTVSGCDVYVDALETVISSRGDVAVSGGTIQAFGGKNGIYSTVGAINVTGGGIALYVEQYGIYSSGMIFITGGNHFITSTASTNDSTYYAAKGSVVTINTGCKVLASTAGYALENQLGSYDASSIKNYDTLEIKSHSWDEGTVTSEATCGKAGVKTYTCKNACGTMKTETIAKKTNHKWNSGVVTTAATCMKEGVKTYTCTAADCGATKTEAVAKKTTHAWNSGIVTTASTCVKEGIKTYTCTIENCNETKTEAVAKKAHTWDSGAVVTKPTCTKEGVKTYTCTFSGCGATKSESVAKASHNYAAATCTAPKTCKVCKATTGSANGHNYAAATCTAPKTCKVCKATTGSANGHNYTAATCTASKTCKVCKATSGNALGHKYSSKYTVDKAATYTAKGSKSKHCTRSGCTAKTSVKSIAKLTLGQVKGLKASKVTVNKSSAITLKWTKTTDAKKYEVQQYVNKKWKTIKTTSKTTYTVKKLKADKSYKFRVRAVVSGAKGKYSSVLKVKTIPAATTLRLKAGTKALTASWSTVSGVTGYQVQYSTSSKMKKAKTTTVKKSTAKKTTIKKLTKGKKYYVRVRTYKTVSGKKVYSAWSAVKSVKVK